MKRKINSLRGDLAHLVAHSLSLLVIVLCWRYVAEQIEAAHKVSLSKAEVGIRDKKPVPTLRGFIDNDFTPFVESRFANKPKTLE